MAKIVQLENKTASDTAEEIQSQNFAENNEEDAEEYERYIPVEQSIIESLLEVREMIAGRLPKKSWREVRAEIEAEFLAEESAMFNERNRNAKIQG